MATAAKKKKPSETSLIKVRPATRKKYEQIKQIKRWKFVEVADVAVDALIDTDSDLKSLRTPAASR